MLKPFNLRAAALVAVALILSACAALGLPEPRDFADRASYAYDVAGEGVATVRAMIAAGELEPDDADNVLDALENYKRGIDVARDVHAVSAAAGEARLAAIRAGLDGLIDYLDERRAPHVGPN